MAKASGTTRTAFPDNHAREIENISKEITRYGDIDSPELRNKWSELSREQREEALEKAKFTGYIMRDEYDNNEEPPYFIKKVSKEDALKIADELLLNQYFGNDVADDGFIGIKYKGESRVTNSEELSDKKKLPRTGIEYIFRAGGLGTPFAYAATKEAEKAMFEYAGLIEYENGKRKKK